MKKFNIYLLAVLTLLFSSCEEELLVFNPNGAETILQFTSLTNNLIIERNGTGSADIEVNVSSIMSTDRTYSLSVDLDKTTVDAAVYSVPATVTIPAGEVTGTFTVTGTDINVGTTAETLVINVTGGEDAKIEGTNGVVTLSVFEGCSFTDGFFTGTYEIEVLSPGVFGAGTFGPTGGQIEISIPTGGTPFDRVFTADYFEDSRFSREFEFILICGEVLVPYKDMLVGCGGNSVNLAIGPPTTNGTFDGTDDSEFIINLTDNVDSDCGGGPVQASYRLTKVQ